MSKLAKFRDSTIGCILILGIICAAVAGALAVTHDSTKDIIADAAAAKVSAALKVVLPSADNFTPVDGVLPDGVLNAYTADNGSGYVFVVAAKGFKGLVNTVVGLDPNGSFVGIKVTEHGETEGIGTKAVAEDHLSKFYGANTTDGVDAISGATVTSSAVKTALGHAINGFNVVAKGASADDFAEASPEEKLTAALASVFPNGGELTQLTANLPSNADATVTAAYTTADGSDSVFVVESKGFGGNVQLAVGIQSDGLIANTVVVSHEETEGIGTNALTDDHLSAFDGLSNANGVDAVSGATVTSNAVQSALATALEAFNSLNQ